ncbi:hypothetical protein [Desulfosporosinus shakirovi]|uniref:hypothetical protein n=1 Tax=Desulfosporosinus shakirovi TaxID=2885154 RepID=UPI001E496894|nr:hypothetical protein [Desulfosporosinus sp. SRJS8]MCB8818656.1 hypothetical protein [Desulfosporosinus sp. SRJS8]
MKIRVFMPDTEEGIQQLKMKVAELHAVAIIDGIQKLPCEADRKLQLFNTIKAEIRNRAEKISQAEINRIKVSAI